MKAHGRAPESPVGTTAPWPVEAEERITLRDYFAAQALPAYIQRVMGEATLIPDTAIARWCYETADAMLRERER